MSDDLTLLHQYFDRTLPVTNRKNLSNGVMFDLFDYTVSIVIEPCDFNKEAKWILDCDSAEHTGYIIDITFNKVTDIEDVSKEFLIFSESLDQVNALVTNLTWDFLVFRGLENHRNKLVEAIAQRMTRLQSGVERMATRHPLTLISRF